MGLLIIMKESFVTSQLIATVAFKETWAPSGVAPSLCQRPEHNAGTEKHRQQERRLDETLEPPIPTGHQLKTINSAQYTATTLPLGGLIHKYC